MPDEYVEHGRSWQRLHPGWELVTWGDDDLDWLQNRAEFDRAERFTTKSNIARYEIVHREGGLYVDCDFEALRPVDELLDGASLVVGEERDGLLANALFAATPGHPTLAYAIDELPRSFAALSDRHSITNTGPEFWTRCVRRASTASAEAPTVLTRDQIYPYGFDPGQRHLRHADFGPAYAVHHWADDPQPVTPRSRWTDRLDPAELRRAVRAGTKRRLATHVKPRIRSAVRRVTGGLPLPFVWGSYVGDNRVLVRTAWGLPLLAFADDLGVTPMLLTDGEYDGGFAAFLASVLDRGDVAVDVGANIGIFTLAMGRAVGETGRVLAYEPNPEVVALLRDNVYLNRNGQKLSAEVRCRPVAVGRVPGSAALRVRPKHRAMGTLVEHGVGAAATGEPVVHHVDVVTLDDELAGLTEIKLVKIDVEGAELDVLVGMRRLLAERRVRFIDVELIDRHAGPAWPELADELRRLQHELGGRFHTIDRHGARHRLDVEAALHHDQLGHLVIELPGR
ncbi:MAG: FkbM family methyltransferase [Acidimicrobiales bacterium]